MAPVVDKKRKFKKKTKSQRLNERAICGRFSNRVRISSSYVGDKNSKSMQFMWFIIN